jgi:hypothetical protein
MRRKTDVFHRSGKVCESMHNRHQKPIRRVDMRPLEKLGLLVVKKPGKNESAVGKIGATRRTTRAARWM